MFPEWAVVEKILIAFFIGKQKKNFLDTKITKQSHAYKGEGSTYSIKIWVLLFLEYSLKVLKLECNYIQLKMR